jgi:hypothetical protein
MVTISQNNISAPRGNMVARGGSNSSASGPSLKRILLTSLFIIGILGMYFYFQIILRAVNLGLKFQNDDDSRNIEKIKAWEGGRPHENISRRQQSDENPDKKAKTYVRKNEDKELSLVKDVTKEDEQQLQMKEVSSRPDYNNNLIHIDGGDERKDGKLLRPDAKKN